MADYPVPLPSGAGFPYTALVGVGAYCLASYNTTAETLLLLRNAEPHDFFDDTPIEGAVRFTDIPRPHGVVECAVVVVNGGTTENATGAFADCAIASYVLEVDGVVEVVQNVSVSLAPFAFTELGGHAMSLPAGWHTVTVLVYEHGNPQPIDVTTQAILVTLREDVTFDGFVGIDDIVAAGEAFGAAPPPLTGSARWNAQADVNDDFYVGIDDIVDIAEDFGTP